MLGERDVDVGAHAADWRASAAEGCRASVTHEPQPAALRFEYEIASTGGWAIARRELAFTLPSHFVAALSLRGAGAACELQLKLVEPGGASVWWWRIPAFAPPRKRRQIVLRRAALAHAWGPASGAEPRAIAAVELAVACDGPVAGTLWLDSLRIEARPAESPARVPVAVRASSERLGCEALRALAREGGGWRAAPDDADPWLELDFGERIEHGGIALHVAGAQARELTLLEPEDGHSWAPLATECVAAGASAWLRGAGEARLLRLALGTARGAEISRLAMVPLTLALAPARHASALARGAARGAYPRHLLGEQAPWALVGVEGAVEKGLLGADGALELGTEGFTLEPFLTIEGRAFSWAGVQAEPTLAADALPIPTVRWDAPGLRLEVTAFAHGPAGASALCVRYRVANHSGAPRSGRLEVAIRPFQVTPAWQALNLTPAFAPIRQLALDGARLRVNDARDVIAVSTPDSADIGVADGSAALSPADAEDPRGFLEGRLGFAFSLAPGTSESVLLAAALTARSPAIPVGLPRAAAAAWGEERLADATAHWRDRLARIPLSLPPAAEALEQSLRASLAWMLLNRAGPRLLGGPRCYARSWVRDGALSGVALAELGFAAELEAFLRWYAPHQLADGRVPCAIGPRGVDSAIEHDSHGQLVWAIAEHWRLGGDDGLLRELWPHALRAVEAIAALREPADSRAAGLLPRSISHEGYASQPVHSYWDDLFALRALGDVADAARALGDGAAHERCSALREGMRRDLAASVASVIAERRLDFVPGSLELADFDPSATAVAFELGLEDALPAAALRAGFERQARELEARREPDARWEACTPYELRSAFAFLRLGQPQRALALLEWFVAQQRPTGWRQWPEVVTRDPRAPRFLGDLPHGWVASSFLRSVRRLIAYEDDEAGILVIGAGVPQAWVAEEPGVRVRGLPTHFGPLDLELRADGESRVRAAFGGSCRPPNGFVLESPLPHPLREVVVDGRARAADDPRRVHLASGAREVELRYRSEGGVE
jgi:hypothetical protein